MFVFFVPTGLGDRDLEVRKHMLNAALKAVNDHGKVGKMLSVKSTQCLLNNRLTFGYTVLVLISGKTSGSQVGEVTRFGRVTRLSI